MTAKVYVVTGLGPGDDGKGGVVQAVAKRQKAHAIIKRGGAQGSHGIQTLNGERFAFSQWGCGTFDGIPTHISQQMIVSPEGLLNEADALRFQFGIHDPFSLLTVDERALCATSYHGIASRLKELSLGGNPRGTIGTGVGQAYRDYQRQPESALLVRDLSSADLRERLAVIRNHARHTLAPYADHKYDEADIELAQTEIDHLYNDNFFEYVVMRCQEAARQVTVVSPDYLGEAILAMPGAVVVETSHGVITDRQVGFHPHTSAIRTLPEFSRQMLESTGFDGQIVNLGVLRAYAFRHGAGPLPTHDQNASERLLPGSTKDVNRWQGDVRVGPLDMVLLRYALAASGGPEVFDGLAVTWFDQVQANQEWQVADIYSICQDDYDYFSPLGEIKLSQESDSEQQAYQARLGQALSRVTPEITRYSVDSAMSRESAYTLCADVVAESTNVPVRMMSFGPTELDKLFR